MANTMITKCPICCEQGSNPVEETQYNFSTTAQLNQVWGEEWDLWYRVRWRQCVRCLNSFRTAEIANLDLDRIIDRASQETTQNRFVRQTLTGHEAEGSEIARLALAERISLLINDALGLWSAVSNIYQGGKVERKSAISLEDLASAEVDTIRSFIKDVAEALGGLDAGIQDWIAANYGLQGLNGVYATRSEEGTTHKDVFKALKRRPTSQQLRRCANLLK